jgi:hypothetical protein
MISTQIQPQPTELTELERKQLHQIVAQRYAGLLVDWRDEDVISLLDRAKGNNRYHCLVCGEPKMSVNPSNGAVSCYANHCNGHEIRKALLGGIKIRLSSEESAKRKELYKSRQQISDNVVRASEIDLDVKYRNRIISNNRKDPSSLIGNRYKRLKDRSFVSDQLSAWIPTYLERIDRKDNDDGEDEDKIKSHICQVFLTISATGLFNGSPTIDENKFKFWHKPYNGASAQLLETKEIPVTVARPPIDGITHFHQATPEQLEQQLKDLPNIIGFTEGVYHKPNIAASRLNQIIIGSPTVGSSLNDITRSIKYLQSIKGPNLTYIIYPDGGSIKNYHVISGYIKLRNHLALLGCKLKVAWWEQFEKLNGDIDEISDEKLGSIAVISFDEFAAKFSDEVNNSLDRNKVQEIIDISDRKQVSKELDADRYKSLTTVSHPNKKYHNEFCQPIISKPSTLSYISSACGTGKTYQLKELIANHEKAHPQSAIVVIIHRVSLKTNLEFNLTIDDYNKSDRHWNSKTHSGKIVIVADSLWRIDPDQLPPNSLIIFDEAEAVLNHVCQGATTQSNTAKIQTIFTNVVRNVINQKGSVICLEDSITDLCIDGYNELSRIKHSNTVNYEVIVNTQQRYTWDIQYVGGEKNKYIALIIEKLNNGEKLFVPTSSKNFAKQLAKYVELFCNEDINKKTLVIHADNTDTHRTFLNNPNSYLEHNDVKLLVCSPTIESGFSLDDKSMSLFDYRMGYFINNETRSHIQSLYRLRSNCPTYIYIEKKVVGEEIVNKKWESEYTRTSNNAQNSLDKFEIKIDRKVIDEVWNVLAAKFRSRAILATSNSYEFLMDDLTARGHNITELELTNDGGMIESVKADVKEKILINETKELFEADVFEMTLEEARMISHQSGVTRSEVVKAKKVLLIDELPGAELTQEFLLEMIIRDNGKYKSQTKKLWFANNPEIADMIELDAVFNATKNNQLHIVNHKISTLGQVSRLYNGIIDQIDQLVHQEKGYDRFDELAISINAWAQKNRYQIQDLLGIKIDRQRLDKNDNPINTPACITNKIIRSLGYKTSSKVVRHGDDVGRLYTVENPDCEHRDSVIAALDRKYGGMEIGDSQKKLTALLDQYAIQHYDDHYLDQALNKLAETINLDHIKYCAKEIPRVLDRLNLIE